MIFTVTSYQPNINFSGRHRIFSKETLNNIFLPLLENKNITKKEFENACIEIPYIVKNRWFKETFDKTMGRFFTERTDEELKNGILEYRSSGISNREIANQYKINEGLSEYRLRKVGCYKPVKIMLDEKLPSLLEAGYTAKTCSEQLNVGIGAIKNWIRENKKEGIVKFRHNNNIIIKHNYDTEGADFKTEFTDFFEKGGTISEAEKKFNLSPSMIYLWLKRLNIKTKRQKIRESLEKQIWEFIEYKMSLPEMSQKIGLSKSAIAKYIKNLTGKNYIELKKQ